MTETAVAKQIEFGDMNGSLVYWGPSPALRQHPLLSLEEQALLFALRDRLEGHVPGAASLGQALEALIDITADLALPVPA